MLADIFSRLSKTELGVQSGKCEIFKESLQILEHRIDAKDIYPSKAKVEANRQACPKNKKKLQAFLGIINLRTMCAEHGTVSPEA
ncbi:hypothetical protein MRX96_016801 [Rhipicephalus microplus]